MTDEELEAPPTEDELVEATDTFDTEEVLAVTALVLAVLSLAGFGLMNGAVYVQPLLTSDGQKTRVVVGALLGALLALVPVWLGWRVIARALPADPRWVVTAARTAMLLGLASAALRIVVAIIEASQDGPQSFIGL